MYRKHPGGIGITDIPDSRTRGPSRVGLQAGIQNTGLPDSRTRGPVAPTVIVFYIGEILLIGC